MFSPRKLLASALAFVIANTLQVRAVDISVFAAASLQEALTEIGSAYEGANGGHVVFNFGASSLLARQIEQGAPADLFFSADEEKIERLEKKALLLADSRRTLLSNTLVVVVPAGAANTPKSIRDLAQPAVGKLALAQPETVPAGLYAREHLQRVGLWDAVKAKVIPAENVRAALAAVASGNVDAGIVYKTDALTSRNVKVAVEIPAAEGPKISYELAILKRSRQVDEARRFAEYLASASARRSFEKFGFIVPR
jgi:molybdate transport system substrate-binding protein